MTALDYARAGKMQMALHLIYEYKKGVRSLALCTVCPTCAALLKERLDRQGETGGRRLPHASLSLSGRHGAEARRWAE